MNQPPIATHVVVVNYVGPIESMYNWVWYLILYQKKNGKLEKMLLHPDTASTPLQSRRTTGGCWKCPETSAYRAAIEVSDEWKGVKNVIFGGEMYQFRNF